MIEAIKNYTYKSFKNYSTPEKFFKQKNILFGYNGRGKSSLSKGIVEEYSKKDTTEESIDVYKRQPKERPKGVSDGQQVDIPVLEYVVKEGRSRLTKACDWKCTSKQ